MHRFQHPLSARRTGTSAKIVSSRCGASPGPQTGVSLQVDGFPPEPAALMCVLTCRQLCAPRKADRRAGLARVSSYSYTAGSHQMAQKPLTKGKKQQKAVAPKKAAKGAAKTKKGGPLQPTSSA